MGAARQPHELRIRRYYSGGTMLDAEIFHEVVSEWGVVLRLGSGPEFDSLCGA